MTTVAPAPERVDLFPRPRSVVAAASLTGLLAAGDVALGASAWLAGGAPGGMTAATEHAVAVPLVLLGLGLAGATVALVRGAGFARATVTLALVVRILLAVAVLALLTLLGGPETAPDLLEIVVAAVALGLLWSRTANAFFLT